MSKYPESIKGREAPRQARKGVGGATGIHLVFLSLSASAHSRCSIMCQALAVSTYNAWVLPASTSTLPGPLSLLTHFQGQMTVVVVAGSSSLGMGTRRASLGRLQVGSVK